MSTPNAILRSQPLSWPVQVQAEPVARSARSRLEPDYFIGLLIAALAPSLVWPLVVKGVGVLTGYAVSWTAMAVLGSAIFVFLAIVYTAIARMR